MGDSNSSPHQKHPQVLQLSTMNDWEVQLSVLSWKTEIIMAATQVCEYMSRYMGAQ